MDNLGMPYMGSKRKLANRIVDTILQDRPNTKYVYDLFGGGGAISFEFLKRNNTLFSPIEKVFYNELNTGVCELLKDIKVNGITEKYNQWIDRETFNKHKNDSDWFGGLCKVIWSFGNNQKSYLFGREIEKIKKQAHVYLFENGYKIGQTEKRILLIKQFKNNEKIKGRFELQRLEQLERLERLQQLQQLEGLEQLERLQQLEQLEISNKSFDEVVINTPVDQTIIYLDPPYENTGKYEIKLDHLLLDEYIKNSPYKIYMSSYENNLKCIAEFKHTTTIGSSSRRRETIEKLFTN